MSATAGVSSFGSMLSAPAALNTTESLSYVGTFTAVPPSPDAPNGVFHTNHWGADSALWNAALANGEAAAPATGQAVNIRLEGCAQEAPNGPSPLNQIHFQDLSPLPGGGVRVNLTSQAYEIPVCGQNGATGATVSSYQPINLCVAQGDYVAFNDEGGFVPNVYRSGVPFQVMGAAYGSTMDSFIRGNGTNNGAIFSPGDKSANDGFAVNNNEELMMRVTLGTGRDATHICAGGTAGLPPTLPPIRVGPQTDGVNIHSIVAVAVYCRLSPVCKGVVTLTVGGKQASVGVPFSVPGKTTSHLPIRVSPRVLALIRRYNGVRANLTAVVGSTTVTQAITVKIF